MDSGGARCSACRDKADNWEIMTNHYQDRTASLHAKEEELKLRISQMESLLSSHLSDSCCCISRTNNVPKTFPKKLESPVRDIPTFRHNPPMPPTVPCSTTQTVILRERSPVTTPTRSPLSSPRSLSPKKEPNAPTFFQKVMENAKSILSLKCNTGLPAPDECPTRECDVSYPSTSQQKKSSCSYNIDEESTRNDLTDSYSQDITNTYCCNICPNSSTVSVKTKKTTSAMVNTGSYCNTSTSTDVRTAVDDQSQFNASSNSNTQTVNLDNCWVLPSLRDTKKKQIKPETTCKKQGCQKTCASYLSLNRRSSTPNVTFKDQQAVNKERSKSQIKEVDIQCAFIGSPLLTRSDYLPAPKVSQDGDKPDKTHTCTCLKKLASKELDTVTEIASKERQIQGQMENLHNRQKCYDVCFAHYQNMMINAPSCCCTQPPGNMDKIDKISQELKLENKMLKDELMQMKLELKHCLEKVEGPMKCQLQTEKMRCEQLERELNIASQNVVINQDTHMKEINALKLQLCMACSNINEMNMMNKRLKGEMSSLDNMCTKLEDDLIKQKINEAETIKRLTRRRVDSYGDNIRDSTCTCSQTIQEKISCDSNLHVIARKLSKTLKESEPCVECANLPAELTGAAKCIKDLSDLVESRKIKRIESAEKVRAKFSKDTKKTASSQAPPETMDEGSQCMEGQRGDEAKTTTLMSPLQVEGRLSSEIEMKVSGLGSAQSGFVEKPPVESTYFSAAGEPMTICPDICKECPTECDITNICLEQGKPCIIQGKTKPGIVVTPVPSVKQQLISQIDLEEDKPAVISQQKESVTPAAIIGQESVSPIPPPLITSVTSGKPAGDEEILLKGMPYDKHEPPSERPIQSLRTWKPPPCTEPCASDEPCAIGQPCFIIKGDQPGEPKSDAALTKIEGVIKPILSVTAEGGEAQRIPRDAIIEPAAESFAEIPESAEKIIPADVSSVIRDATSTVEPPRETPSARSSVPLEDEKQVGEQIDETEIEVSFTGQVQQPILDKEEYQITETDGTATEPTTVSELNFTPEVSAPTDAIVSELSVTPRSELPSLRSSTTAKPPVTPKLTSTVGPSDIPTISIEELAALEETIVKEEIAAEMPSKISSLVRSVDSSKRSAPARSDFTKPSGTYDPGAPSQIEGPEYSFIMPTESTVSDVPIAVEKTSAIPPSIPSIPRDQSIASKEEDIIEYSTMVPSESVASSIKQKQFPVTKSVSVQPDDRKILSSSTTPVQSIGKVGQPFLEERTGNFPFDVDTKVEILDRPPSDFHVTTMITASGTLEVITEGPEGIIETTLVYQPDGTIEVVTHLTTDEGKIQEFVKKLSAAGTPSALSAPDETTMQRAIKKSSTPATASVRSTTPVDDQTRKLDFGQIPQDSFLWSDATGLETVTESTKETSDGGSFMTDLEKSMVMDETMGDTTEATAATTLSEKVSAAGGAATPSAISSKLKEPMEETASGTRGDEITGALSRDKANVAEEWVGDREKMDYQRTGMDKEQLTEKSSRITGNISELIGKEMEEMESKVYKIGEEHEKLDAQRTGIEEKQPTETSSRITENVSKLTGTEMEQIESKISKIGRDREKLDDQGTEMDREQPTEKSSRITGNISELIGKEMEEMESKVYKIGEEHEKLEAQRTGIEEKQPTEKSSRITENVSKLTGTEMEQIESKISKIGRDREKLEDQGTEMDREQPTEKSSRITGNISELIGKEMKQMESKVYKIGEEHEKLDAQRTGIEEKQPTEKSSRITKNISELTGKEMEQIESKISKKKTSDFPEEPLEDDLQKSSDISRGMKIGVSKELTKETESRGIDAISMEVPLKESTRVKPSVVSDKTAKQAVAIQKRDCGCQAIPQTEQSCQCCECKDVGVSTSRDSETITDTNMVQPNILKSIDQIPEETEPETDLHMPIEISTTSQDFAQAADTGQVPGTTDEISTIQEGQISVHDQSSIRDEPKGTATSKGSEYTSKRGKLIKDKGTECACPDESEEESDKISTEDRAIQCECWGPVEIDDRSEGRLSSGSETDQEKPKKKKPPKTVSVTGKPSADSRKRGPMKKDAVEIDDRSEADSRKREPMKRDAVEIDDRSEADSRKREPMKRDAVEIDDRSEGRLSSGSETDQETPKKKKPPKTVSVTGKPSADSRKRGPMKKDAVEIDDRSEADSRKREPMKKDAVEIDDRSEGRLSSGSETDQEKPKKKKPPETVSVTGKSSADSRKRGPMKKDASIKSDGDNVDEDLPYSESKEQMKIRKQKPKGKTDPIDEKTSSSLRPQFEDPDEYQSHDKKTKSKKDVPVKYEEKRKPKTIFTTDEQTEEKLSSGSEYELPETTESLEVPDSIPASDAMDSKKPKKQRTALPQKLQNIQCDCMGVCQCVVCSPKIIAERKALAESPAPLAKDKERPCWCPPAPTSEVPPQEQKDFVPDVVSSKTFQKQHPPGCQCLDCLCDNCTPCPPQYTQENIPIRVDDVFQPPECASVRTARKIRHALNCECIDCLCLPDIRKIAELKEHPIIRDNKQIYQVKCYCENTKKPRKPPSTSRIPIATNSTTGPPKAKTTTVNCTCDDCRCSPCSDVSKKSSKGLSEKKAISVAERSASPSPAGLLKMSPSELAKLCDCKNCQCVVCFNKPPKKPGETTSKPDTSEPKGDKKICCCKDECICGTCPVQSKKTEPEASPTKISDHPADCVCTDCFCPETRVEKSSHKSKPETSIEPKSSQKAKPETSTEPNLSKNLIPECICGGCVCPGKDSAVQAVGDQAQSPSDCVCDVCPCPYGEVLKPTSKSSPSMTPIPEKLQIADCDCVDCKCNPCADPKKRKPGDGPPVIAPCDCPDCKCDPCADPSKRKDKGDSQEVEIPGGIGVMTTPPSDPVAHAVSTGVGSRYNKATHPPDCICDECLCEPETEKHETGCSCPECKCEDCYYKISVGVHAEGCKCIECICAPCNKKEGAGAIGVSTRNVESGAGEETKPAHKAKQEETQDDSCTCGDCLCVVCYKKGVGSEKGCTCAECLCVECPNKGITTEDMKAEAKSAPSASVATDVKPVTISHSCHCIECVCDKCSRTSPSKQLPTKDCSCEVCQCSDCGKNRIEPATTGAECTCPVCQCGDCPGLKTLRAAGDDSSHPDDCICDKCICTPDMETLITATQELPTGIAKTAAAEPVSSLTDPPPFEVPVHKPCTCSKCECLECSKVNASPTATATIRSQAVTMTKSVGVVPPATTEAPPFEVPVRKACNCGKCDCIDCNKLAGIPLPGSSSTATRAGPGLSTDVRPFEFSLQQVCNCGKCGCTGCKKETATLATTTSFPTNRSPLIIDQPPRAASTMTKCVCPTCTCADQVKGLVNSVPSIPATQRGPAAVSTRTMTKCTCPTCTCPEDDKTVSSYKNSPTTKMPQIESKSTGLLNKEYAASTEKHPVGCPCPECCACPEKIASRQLKTVDTTKTEEMINISQMDNEALVRKIQMNKQENCKCKEQIKEIRRALEKIKCSCTEAEMKAIKNTTASGKPFIKQASAFGQTMSGLKFALNNLQEKCKAKDKLIEVMTGELKTRTSSNTFDKVLNTTACADVPDYDKSEDVKSFERNPENTTNILFAASQEREIAHTSVRPKISEYSGRKHKKKCKLCKCGKHHKDKDNSKVDLSGFEVVDIRRITQDSIIIKWKPPQSNIVNGYDIFVNGVNKSKVMSGGRTSAMVHSLDLSSTIQITIYAVTKCGRCEPPAIAIYEINT